MPRWLTRMHVRILHLTRGRLMSSIGGQPVLLLTTVGRRSGAKRTTPVQYLATEAGYLVAAAAGGAPHPPAWSFNLDADPQGSVVVRGNAFPIHAKRLEGAEREENWAEMCAANRYLKGVERKAGRQLGIYRLEPVSPPGRRPAGPSR